MPRGFISKGSYTRCAAVAMLCFLVPVAAWANSSCQPMSVCFGNSGGTMTGTPSTGFQLNGMDGSIASTINSINGNPATGTLAFTLGSVIPGAITMSNQGLNQSVYFNPGTITITGSYAGFTGVLFSGTFGTATDPAQWELIAITGHGANATYQYDLEGVINGTWYTGQNLSGQTFQFLFTTHGGRYTGGAINLENGSTYIITPEPGTLGLVGTGLLGLALKVRQRVRDHRSRFEAVSS